MRIQHKANVLCLVVNADTEQGKKMIGRACWLYRGLEAGESVSEFNYKFVARGTRCWIIIFEERDGTQTASFFEEYNLLPLFDGNNPQNPDTILRLENKNK